MQFEVKGVLASGMLETTGEPGIDGRLVGDRAAYAPERNRSGIGVDLGKKAAVVVRPDVPAYVVQSGLRIALPHLPQRQPVLIIYGRAILGIGGDDLLHALGVFVRGLAELRLRIGLGIGGIQPLVEGAKGARGRPGVNLASVAVEEIKGVVEPHLLAGLKRSGGDIPDALPVLQAGEGAPVEAHR